MESIVCAAVAAAGGGMIIVPDECRARKRGGGWNRGRGRGEGDAVGEGGRARQSATRPRAGRTSLRRPRTRSRTWSQWRQVRTARDRALSDHRDNTPLFLCEIDRTFLADEIDILTVSRIVYSLFIADIWTGSLIIDYGWIVDEEDQSGLCCFYRFCNRTFDAVLQACSLLSSSILWG